MWIFWALISALLAAIRRTNEKQLTHQLNHFTIALSTQLFSLPIIGSALLLHGTLLNPLRLGLRFWLPLLVISIGFYPLNAFLYLQAIKHNELSSVLPIQSLWPVLSLLPAAVFLAQIPSAISIIGILLTVIGVYVVSMKDRILHHPLQPFRENQGSRYMLLAVTLVSLAGVLDKIAIDASNALYYSFASTVGAVVVLAITLCYKRINELPKIRSQIKNLSLIGSLQGASYSTYLLAIASGPLAYVAALRSSNILIGAVLGIVVLKESFTVYKAASFGLIIIGGILLTQ